MSSVRWLIRLKHYDMIRFEVQKATISGHSVNSDGESEQEDFLITGT